jgi:hypothetical protein
MKDGHRLNSITCASLSVESFGTQRTAKSTKISVQISAICGKLLLFALLAGKSFGTQRTQRTTKGTNAPVQISAICGKKLAFCPLSAEKFWNTKNTTDHKEHQDIYRKNFYLFTFIFYPDYHPSTIIYHLIYHLFSMNIENTVVP